MTALLDRLQEALAPEYEVERELASGGMGVVFVGRDVALDRRVAIKIIRPELATAAAAERFVREARILASLNHPNVIPVHRAGESRGLYFYVMEYLEAETLADRLGRGPLPAAEAVAVARDVLSALEAAHARGVIHRDVKPANIFLLKGRAILADFGIAKDTSASGTALTADGRVVGSPGYMAPEQMAGGDLAATTDLYAVGLVLYESLSGECWPMPADPASSDWTRVPAWLVPVLRRALAWHAADRWHSAGAFARALSPARALRWSRANWLVPGLATAVVAVLVLVFLRPAEVAPPTPTTLRIHLRPFAAAPPVPRALGDSLAAALAQSLGGGPDFSVELDRGAVAHTGPGLVLGGTARLDGGSLLLAVRTDTAEPGAPQPAATVAGPLAAWRALAADSLGAQVLVQIWSARGGRLAADLPLKALPQTPRGVTAWIAAERLFARAQWHDARTAYRHAIAVDSTCLLCLVRLTDVGRWLGRDLDTSETSRYRTRIALFPRQYRLIIAASFADHETRWRLLDSATERAADFGLAWFVKGDETYHRGPLDGFRRHDALAAMQRATTIWPDFAPGWEHLAWIALAEGDSALAGRALDSLARVGSGEDPFEVSIRTLLRVCYRWRFGKPDEAARYTLALLTSPAVGQFKELAAGARYLMTCDAPAGSVWLGEAFQHVGRTDLEEPGLLAEIYGYLALGRPAAARAVGARVRSLGAAPAVELFLDELPAALLLADSAGPAVLRSTWPDLRRGLEPFVAGAEPDLARRAAWLLTLTARRAGDTAAARRYRASVAGDPALAALADADEEASAGRVAQALRRSDPLLALDSAGGGDPYYRSFLHLMRAQWHARLGDTAAAVRDLRWHENNNLRVVESVSPAPEPAEVDWSLGTLARWRRARLLARPGDAEACACYAAVARLWGGGEPPYAARADTARRRYAALGCGRDP